ncbi:unnamed protein product [Eruca vesicaria subsp. sativa]|uniref:PGG domain-containing protein n=1 Tax=Eruca vesicaria subsp. sativa TaxID=29727 RepID=A0ABC8IRE0_ERUVS|nr:unnamed protein product [Eruca vesicaria subsp. sativa]
MNLIYNGVRTRRLSCFPQCSGESIESVPEFFTNLIVSDLFHLPSEYVLMNPEIFSAVSAGNKECLEKLRSYGTPMACLKSSRGDSVLHLAATWGHLELVKSIVSECPCLLIQPNSMNQIPIHAAARAGHLAVVEALVASVTYLSARLCEEERKSLNLYDLKDRDGDTALHLALTGRNVEIAACLVNLNQRASFLANKDGISPLYLAVEAGNVSLVKAMLKTTNSNGLEGRKYNFNSQLEGKKFLVHVALKGKNTDVIDVILKEDSSIGDERDEEGMTCLSFGASIGFYKGVCNLLDRSTKSVYICNDDGSFPIHLAAKNGHIRIVKEILKRCPDSKHLLNKQGQNVLHIAANSGRYLLLFHFTNCGKTKHLAVEQDLDGNTPLHLATMKWRPRALPYLSRVSGSLYMRNNSGLTALDIAESNVKPNYIFRERVTLMVLVYCYAIREFRLQWTKKLTKPSEPLNCGKNKEYISALLLVAALVATVTFAAGFTIPGGFNNSAPNLGMATLANDPNLFYFLVFDTLAMQSAVVTIATLIWAQLGDPALAHRSLYVALPSLFFALFCMPCAFYFGVVITVGKVRGLVVVLSVISMIFFLVMLFVLGPHVILQIPGIPAFFGVFFLHFMWFVNDEDDHIYQTSVKVASGDRVGKSECL